MLKKLMILAVALVLLRMSVYTVDAAEYAYVTLLGRHQATHDGADSETGAGLHVGLPWPFQAVQRLDRRVQITDLQPAELLTYDAVSKSASENLTVEAYATWKIADLGAVDRFIQKLGNMEQARKILANRIGSDLRGMITQMAVDDLISIEAGKQPGKTRVEESIESLQSRILEKLRAPVLEQYGIDFIDIRLRRFNYPVAVRPKIFDRIRSERKQKAAKYEAEGDYLAKKIESAAELEKREKLAQARFEEAKLLGQADSEAMLIRNQAHSQDPEFYAFLKKMDKLQSILGDNRTVLLLSTHRPLFELLFSPPRPDMGPMPEKKDKKASGGGL